MKVIGEGYLRFMVRAARFAADLPVISEGLDNARAAVARARRVCVTARHTRERSVSLRNESHRLAIEGKTRRARAVVLRETGVPLARGPAGS